MPLPPPLHPSSVLRRPHRTPSLWGGPWRHCPHHRGSPERWGSAPGGVGDASGSERASRHPSSIRPSTAHSHRPPPATHPPHPRAGRGCSWRPAREPAAAEKARGRACGAGQGEVAEAPVWAREGRPAPLGWAAGRWAEAAGQRLPDETKAYGRLCLRIASHTRVCTHRLVQPSKHQPVRTRTGHTDAKARRGSSRRCSSGPATRTRLCFCVPLSCTCTGSHAHTRIPPRAPTLESHIWSPPASPSRAPSLSLTLHMCQAAATHQTERERKR